MPWSRMLFRQDVVWVHVDDKGRLVLDGSGRAEMKYRVDDPRSYRPSAANLSPHLGGDGEARPSDGAEPAPRRRARPAAKSDDTPLAAANRGGDAVEVWTDGACSGNPGPMGIGVVLRANGQLQERGEFLGEGTNNIAELVALERGLEMAAAAADTTDPSRPVLLHSDSSYAIGVIGRGWKAKANPEIVARIRRRMAGMPAVTLVKVAGHAGVVENERCDELARDAINRRTTWTSSR